MGVRLSKGLRVRMNPQACPAAASHPWRTMSSRLMSTWGAAVKPVDRPASRTYSRLHSSCREGGGVHTGQEVGEREGERAVVKGQTGRHHRRGWQQGHETKQWL